MAAVRKKAAVSAKSSPDNSTTLAESQDPSPAPKPAAVHRRLKKRESDRRCQKQSRERTKSRITYLEELVEKLSKDDGSGKVESLLQSMKQIQEERDSLARKVKTIENILFPASASDMKSAEHETTASRPPELDHDLEPSSSCGTALSTAWMTRATDHTSFEICATSPVGRQVQVPTIRDAAYRQSFDRYTDLRESFSPTARPWPAASDMEPFPLFPSLRGQMCECGYAKSLKNQELNFWYQGNATLSAWMRWPSLVPPVLEHDPYHDDIPIRAVVEGWDSVEQRGHIHPMWRLLRIMDERLFVHAYAPLNRMGILYNVSRVLSAHIDPTRKQYSRLPRFFRPPGDPHCAYATYFVAWPGIREVLDKNEHRYCSNHFWKTFINSMRSEWPYEFRDCYLYNSKKDMYQISPSYAEVLQNIQKIGVTKTFFEHYPELENAVNVVDEGPHPTATGPAPSSGPEADGDMDFFHIPQSEVWSSDPKSTPKRGESYPVDDALASLFENPCPQKVEAYGNHDFASEIAYISGRDFL